LPVHCGCFVDAGANLGYFTLPARSIVGETGKVYAFEPRSRVFSMLASSIKENNLDNVYAHKMALGAGNGSTELVFPRDEFNLGGSQLENGRNGHDTTVERETVTITTLDAAIPDDIWVDLIKIDIEGAEPLLFKGARRTIARCRPRIVCEVNAPSLKSVSNVGVVEFIAMVEAAGYMTRILGGDAASVRPVDFARASDTSPILTAVFEPV
jgi:FkbM family methyltransferase